MQIRIGVLTASDRASAGVYEDDSGRAVIEVLRAYLASAWEPVYRVVSDERSTIAGELARMIDEEGCCLVVTTGGTGPSARDVTPEATQDVCEKILPGFGEQMRAVSVRGVPTAILSRQTAGVRGSGLIINLPGKPASIRQCLEVVFPAVPHCIELIGGPRLSCRAEAMEADRPKS